MVLSVHGHLSTARRHPPTVALPASSSGTREPRFGISMHRPHFHDPRHAQDGGTRGYCSTCTHAPTSMYLGGLNSATTYCRSAARMLGSLVTDPWVQNWAVFHRHDSHASIAAFNHGAVAGHAQYSQDSGTRCRCGFSGSLGVWNPDNIRGTILGRESGGSLESTTTTYCFRLSSAGLMRSCSMQLSRTRQN